jgi:type I restriction enzyme S subunit
MKHFRRGELETTFLPFPPLGEQQKITEILSTVDEAIQKTDEITAKGERLKKALMNELLTGRIRVREENGRLSFYRETELQETEIGKIPRDWRTFSLKEAFELYKGTTPSTKDSRYWGGTIPFVTPTDITAINDLNMIYLTKTEKYLTEEGIRSKNLRIVPRGSLLFTSRATIGYLAINNVDVTINQGVIALIPKRKDVNILYYYYYLLRMKKKFEELAGGSTYREISMAMFSKTIIPQPPLQEQNRIANILSLIDRAIELYHRESEKLKRLKRSLMDLLLTGKVRVVDGDVGS